MIYTRLNGGLGNQLFQYAAGRALSIKHAVSLCIDAKHLERSNAEVTPRRPELHNFKWAGRLASSTESRRLGLIRYVSPFTRLFHLTTPYVEKRPQFNVEFNRLGDDVYLIGYWQSFKYFTGIANLLFQDLKPASALSRRSENIAQQIDATLSVALHVRRGDYVSLRSASIFHGVLSGEYYMAAVASVNASLALPNFFVFSDDLEWCRANLKLGDSAVFVDHNAGEDAWQDLILMGRCQHHIIANSSFSWWGAWLADQRWSGSNRLVIAPKQWFGSTPQQDLSDRFPAHWLSV